MTEEQSYRQIMKATTLFGGVQVFNILISIIRSKFIAVLLGPAGMGIMGLLTSTIGIITSLTNFGLGTSAVKNIASAFGTGDEKRIGTVVTALRKMVWITGLLGLITTAILSPWLSQLTFGNRDYTLVFIWLSVTLFLNQLSVGQMVQLQGMRQLNYLVKANLSGSVIGLFVTLPLYYFWGIDGIVPGMIGTSLVTLLMSWHFSGKVKVEKVALTHSQTIIEGMNMLQMGFMISLSGFLSVGASYIVRIYINNIGGIEQVGLYTAGFAIINTYVGLIFNAMGTDYYPRLSAVSHDNKLCKQTINQQAEIALLILAPILIIFLIFINWMIILLYSQKFIDVNHMIYWAALGMLFKAPSWSIAFAFLAKGDSKLFFWNELVANIVLLGLNILGYHLWGLTGLGISFAVNFVFYLAQVYFVTRGIYEFNFNRTFIKIFVIQFGLVFTGFLAVKYLNYSSCYILGVVLITVSSWYSIRELDKRLGLLSILKNYQHK